MLEADLCGFPPFSLLCFFLAPHAFAAVAMFFMCFMFSSRRKQGTRGWFERFMSVVVENDMNFECFWSRFYCLHDYGRQRGRRRVRWTSS